MSQLPKHVELQQLPKHVELQGPQPLRLSRPLRRPRGRLSHGRLRHPHRNGYQQYGPQHPHHNPVGASLPKQAELQGPQQQRLLRPLLRPLGRRCHQRRWTHRSRGPGAWPLDALLRGVHSQRHLQHPPAESASVRFLERACAHRGRTDWSSSGRRRRTRARCPCFAMALEFTGFNPCLAIQRV